MKLSQQSHLVLADYQTNRFKVGGFPFEIKCWEPETHPLHLKKTDMIWQQLVHVQYENEDRLLPKIFLDVKIFNDFVLLGKNTGYTQMNSLLSALWKLNGGYDLTDVGHGFFMAKFDQENDRQKSWTEILG